MEIWNLQRIIRNSEFVEWYSEFVLWKPFSNIFGFYIIFMCKSGYIKWNKEAKFVIQYSTREIQIFHLKIRIRDLKFGFLEFRISFTISLSVKWNAEFAIWNSGFDNWNSEYSIWDSEWFICYSETQLNIRPTYKDITTHKVFFSRIFDKSVFVFIRIKTLIQVLRPERYYVNDYVAFRLNNWTIITFLWWVKLLKHFVFAFIQLINLKYIICKH